MFPTRKYVVYCESTNALLDELKFYRDSKFIKINFTIYIYICKKLIYFQLLSRLLSSDLMLKYMLCFRIFFWFLSEENLKCEIEYIFYYRACNRNRIGQRECATVLTTSRREKLGVS